MRERHIIIIFVVSTVLLLAGCAKDEQTQVTFGAPGTETDIMQLNHFRSKTDPEENEKAEIQMGKIYQNIIEDNSKEATRTIGKIDGKKISAKDFELRALRFRSNGSETPYADAWDAMILESAESQFLNEKKINIENYVETEQESLKKMFQNDKEVRNVFTKVMKIYGMSESEFWLKNEDTLRKVIAHGMVSDYLEENDMPPLSIDDVSAEITDSVYREKIKER